ncbi:MAG: chitobiase/beta-hexosaminidase C-terminal domain-containing protein, partial [Oscillospiraceae bacterium]|nr:chitobiase/beta-hexosaminidase C-terminal domain-containing protein [Oscillospiraceae bacterium]
MFNVQIPITVNAVVQTAIAVTGILNKSTYFNGDIFDASGISILRIYNNGVTAEITDGSYSLSHGTLTPDVTNVIVTDLNALQFTSAIPVTVRSIEVDSLEIAKEPNKTSYKVGDVFDPTGIVVRAEYNNGDIDENAVYDYSPKNPLTEEDTVITIFSGNKICEIQITVEAWQTVDNPYASHNNGEIILGSEVTLYCATPDAIIYYTLDGSEPTTGDEIYTSPILINANTTIKAKAFKEGMKESETEIFYYTIYIPTIDPDAPTIRVSNAKGSVGSEITVVISLENNPGITAMMFDVNFDDTVLQLMETNANMRTTLLNGWNAQTSVVGNASPVRFAWRDGLAEIDNDNDGVIVNLKFKIIKDELGAYPITLTLFDDFITNSATNEVSFIGIAGFIEVIDFVSGDVNGDNRINFTDATLVERYAAGWDNITINDVRAADVNEDGRINFTDATLIERHAAGWSGYEILPMIAQSSQFAPFAGAMAIMSGIPTIEVAEIIGATGTIIEVPIKLENNPGITAMMFDVNFDDTSLRLAETNANMRTNLLNGWNAQTSAIGKSSPVRFAWRDGLAEVDNDSDGIIVNLKFEIITGTPGTYPVTITLFDDFITNAATNEVYFDVINGSVNVIVPIDIPAISGVTPPAPGAAPVSAINETAQYTGTVSWSGNPTTFENGTAYTATITLTEKTGYTLVGVPANFFTVAGASSTNAADSGIITAVFPATPNAPLTGTATISNTSPKFGDTLTGSLVGGNNTGTLGYIWKADGTQVGTGSTYSVSAADIGKAITLEISSSVQTGTITSTPTAAVAKATGIFGSPSAANATYTPTLTLADLTLPAGYTFDAPATSLSAGNNQTFAATYADPSGNYETATGSIMVNVAKATPAPLTWPTASPITLGQALSASTLSGGTATGAWSWETQSTIPALGTNGYPVVFTPSDTANYDWSGVTLKQNVNVNVTDKESIDISGDLDMEDSIYHPSFKVYYTGSPDLTGAAWSSPTTTALYTGTANDNTSYSSPTPPTDAGSYTVTVTVEDDLHVGIWTQNFTISKAPQDALAITDPGTKTYGDSAFPLSTTGGTTGGTVTYTLVSGPATLSGNTVAITGAGSIVVTAEMAGDNNYEKVTSPELTIMVNKATLTKDKVNFSIPQTHVYNGSAQGIGAVTVPDGGTGTTVTVYYDGTATNPTDAGIYEVSITVASSPNYDDISSPGLILGDYEIKKADQTLTAANITKTIGDGDIDLTAHATSSVGTDSGAITYAVTDAGSTRAVIVADTLSYDAAGTAKITATAAGSANYNAATVEFNLIVSWPPIGGTA